MTTFKLLIMWCFIISAIAAALYLPHMDDVMHPASRKDMNPVKVERVQNYVVEELFIVLLLTAGGAITIRWSAATAARSKSLSCGAVAAPQKDAEPSAEPPLLVLTDDKGRFVI